MSTHEVLHDDANDRARAAAADIAREVAARDAGWPLYAALAGFVGAFVVAVTFLIVDLAHGRPALWTPALLGRVLFLGQGVSQPGAIAPLDSLVLISGYTFLHGAVFVAFGGIAAQISLAREARWTVGAGVTLAVGLFLALQLTFLGFAWAFEPTLPVALGLGWISLANAAAAVSIALVMGWVVQRARATRRDAARRRRTSRPEA